MEDQEIIALFISRSEQAVAELDGKYGSLLHRISGNILHSDEDAAEEAVSARELGWAIRRFLDGLEPESRVLFLRRYWFSDPVKDIAAQLGISENAVSARLRRLRIRLQQYLQEEGYP